MSLAIEIIKIIFYLIVFAGILYAAKYSSQFIADKNKKMYSSGRLKLLERIPMGRDKELALIEFEKNRYIIGITNSGINVIDKLLKEDKGNYDNK